MPHRQRLAVGAERHARRHRRGSSPPASGSHRNDAVSLPSASHSFTTPSLLNDTIVPLRAEADETHLVLVALHHRLHLERRQVPQPHRLVARAGREQRLAVRREDRQ